MGAGMDGLRCVKDRLLIELCLKTLSEEGRSGICNQLHQRKAPPERGYSEIRGVLVPGLQAEVEAICRRNTDSELIRGAAFAYQR
jgi:hypothetical protein